MTTWRPRGWPCLVITGGRRNGSRRPIVQVARLLYRRRDIDRLTALGAQLAAWQGARTTDKELAEIVEAAVKMLGKDLDGVIEVMSRVSSRDDHDRTIYDPGLLEFSGEIVADAIARGRPARHGRYQAREARWHSDPLDEILEASSVGRMGWSMNRTHR